ncbi:hypothetical protein [Haloarcula montana]|uniref:hypothetical protein n=1 Tax=Haloarcula montana TaxID=3111776 RepID=UPI002D767F21|nr:hypothetical protein [Haloarcula sp. GH36]
MNICKPSVPDSQPHHSKRTLFCRSCEHASPIDGDWIMDDSVHHERRLCPRCGAVVDQPAI